MPVEEPYFSAISLKTINSKEFSQPTMQIKVEQSFSTIKQTITDSTVISNTILPIHLEAQLSSLELQTAITSQDPSPTTLPGE